MGFLTWESSFTDRFTPYTTSLTTRQHSLGRTCIPLRRHSTTRQPLFLLLLAFTLCMHWPSSLTVQWVPGLVMTASSGPAVEITSTCFITSTLIATTEPCTSHWTGSLAPMLAAKKRFQRSGMVRSLERRQMRQQCMLQVPKQERLSNQLRKRNTCKVQE